MHIIQPSFAIESFTPNLLENIERAIRTCYKSEDKIEEDSAIKIIQKIKDNKHESCLEHGAITVRFICDRGVTHELVRHRIAAYSQESTRYCNYGKDKFGSEITVIEPFFFDKNDRDYWLWAEAMKGAETAYLKMLKCGCSPQEARSVLPSSLKTEIVVTANPREWRHIFTMRTSSAAHPQIRQIMCPLLTEFRMIWPTLFDDIGDIEHPYPARNNTIPL